MTQAGQPGTFYDTLGCGARGPATRMVALGMDAILSDWWRRRRHRG